MTLNNSEFVNIINSLIVDDHIKTSCAEFIPTCYNLFYNATQLDVTFSIVTDGVAVSYTIPNMAKNVGAVPQSGVIDPENNVTGDLGYFYYNTITQKIFFKSTAGVSATGWVLLFQYVTSPTEDDVMENINKVLISSESIVSTYYDMFYNPNPKDVVIQAYDKSSGTLVSKTIPNRAKSLKEGIYGSGTPEGTVSASIGTIYVDITQNNVVYVKLTSSGTIGWYQILDANSLVQHNTSNVAHQGYLARLNGSTDQIFNVADPVASNHAVNINYTGALSNLNTTDKSSLVGAINELQNNKEELVEEISLFNTTPWTMINGNVDSSGDADLLVSSNANTIYEDVTADVYLDNSNEGSWGRTEDDVIYYDWGNEGGVFGWPKGSGFIGYSKKNNVGYDAQAENRGQAGSPIIHEFTPALGSGTYMFAVCGNGYNFTLKATYDGIEHTITLPTLTTGEWVYTSTFSVNTSLTQISAVSASTSGTWGIGAVHLIKVVNSGFTLNKTYFKANPKYQSVTGVDALGHRVDKPALASIDLANTANGTYNVFLPASKYNKNIFNIVGSLNVYESGLADTFNINNYATMLTNITTSSSFSLGVRYQAQYDQRIGEEAIILQAINIRCFKLYEEDDYDTTTSTATKRLKISLGQGGSTWSKEGIVITNLTAGIVYNIKVVYNGTDYKIYVDDVLKQTISYSTAISTINGLYIGSNLVDYTKGKIFLNSLKAISDGSLVVEGYATRPYLKSGSIYKQKTVPSSPSTGTIWKDVSVSPIQVKEYDGTGWKDFNDICIGSVTVASHVLTSVTTNPYCDREVGTATSVAPAYITYSWENGTEWRRVWSNGFAEQGGQVSLTTSATSISFASGYNYKNTNYCISYACTAGTATFSNKATSGFKLTGSTSSTCNWKTSGFIK